MIFTCDNCGFIFSRTEETDQCPDCGKHAVRPANEAEQDEFEQRMAELAQSERSEAPRIPDLWDAEISMLSSFSFRLPSTALQISSMMVVDVIVEYTATPKDMGVFTAYGIENGSAEKLAESRAFGGALK